ncbi:hypothetical protein [Sulfuriferula sp. AH1]|uniref:hypothetical protein n=1 Tax=Sulfuriferula sp. AH1 TaxID=1985873 RepID=UPI0012F85AD8|nr:hypothetical protein [Sulfuriferula sp. AH1]
MSKHLPYYVTLRLIFASPYRQQPAFHEILDTYSCQNKLRDKVSAFIIAILQHLMQPNSCAYSSNPIKRLAISRSESFVKFLLKRAHAKATGTALAYMHPNTKSITRCFSYINPLGEAT